MSKPVWKIPKKKRHTGWIIFGVLMTVLVVFPITFVFAAFYDPTTKKVSDSDIHYENLVSETFYKGLENLGDDGELKFTINEEMIDGIMMSACDKINQKQFIPKMYCEINGNNYDFFIDLKAFFFKSRVILHTSLTQSETDILTFNIKGITIGRLPLPISWVTGIAGNFINDDMLNSVFESAGFNIKSHLAEAKLTYSKEDFKNDIGTYVEDLAGNNDYLNFLLNVVGANGDRLFSADYKDGVSATIKLHDLSTPAGYQPLLTYQAEELAKYKSSIANWLTSGHLKEKDEGVEDSRDRVADVFSFLIRGYDLSSNEVKEFIDSIHGTPLYNDISECTGYTDLKECKGCVVAINGSTLPTTFKGYCGSANELDVGIYPSLPNSFSVTLDGDEMNAYLANNMSEAIGMTIPITYKSGDQWNFEYIFIDNFFVNFDDVDGVLKMDIYLSLNVSGYPICMKLSNQDIDIEGADESLQSIGNLVFKLKEVSFGLVSIEQEQFSWLNDLLTKMQGESFTYDNGRFLIGLDSFMEDAETRATIAGIINNPLVQKDFSATNNELNLTFSVNS